MTYLSIKNLRLVALLLTGLLHDGQCTNLIQESVEGAELNHQAQQISTQRDQSFYPSIREAVNYIMFEREFQETSAKARNGDAWAQNKLGSMYLQGKGTFQNGKKAFESFLKAAEQGHTSGQSNVGRLYLLGIGTEKNIEKALDYTLKAAEKESIAAIGNLGDIYLILKDYPKALNCFLKASDQQFGLANLKLGYMYFTGLGVQENDDKAYMYFKLYTTAEPQLSGEAQRILELYFQEPILLSEYKKKLPTDFGKDLSSCQNMINVLIADENQKVYSATEYPLKGSENLNFPRFVKKITLNNITFHFPHLKLEHLAEIYDELMGTTDDFN